MPFVGEVAFEPIPIPRHAKRHTFLSTDGVMFEGQRLRVEMSKGSADAYGMGSRYLITCSDSNHTAFNQLIEMPLLISSSSYSSSSLRPASKPPPRDLRRSEFRVIISGLPPSASWQDLKDYFRSVWYSFIFLYTFHQLEVESRSMWCEAIVTNGTLANRRGM
jgi:hypothetical protein